jgi:methylmalonyl-CoA/ethylmalonyl-CoA epimerase
MINKITSGDLEKMIRSIDHVGIVVKNIGETVGILSKTFGFEVIETIDAPNGEFKTAIVSCGDTKLELIEPVSGQGSIAKFLEQRGGGMHHLSFRVDDIEEELRSLEAKGVRLVNNKPSSVASTLVAFVHPGSTGGVLVELIQKV